MAGFADKFKSFVGQAREKIAEYKENLDSQWFETANAHAAKREYQKAVNLLKLISASSDIYEEAQQKLVKYTDAWAKDVLHQSVEMTSQNSLNQAISSLRSVPKTTSLYQQVQEKITKYTAALEYLKKREKFDAAAIHAAKQEYQKAVSILKEIPASSEEYKEAQQKIAEYVLTQAANMASQSSFNQAILCLKTIPETASSYQQAQAKINEYTEALEKFITKHKNLIPMRSGDKIIAAAFIDQTVHIISNIERKKSIYSSFGSTYADGEFLILRLLVRNDNKKARTISVSTMTIIDSLEREFSVSNEGNMALQMNGDRTVEFLVTEVQPGLQKVITIVFDVPPGTNNLSLKVSSGGWGGTAVLPLSLAV